FGGRILGQGKPKYMNSPESMVFSKRDLLFGLYQHRQAIRSSRRAIVVEGNFDLLLLAIHGIENVVAPLGTALTREHITALRRYCDEVVLLFDGDSAGLRAARRSIPFFLSEQLDVRVALLPTGHDPDTLIREKGATAVQALIEAADPLAEFVFSVLQEEHGLTLSGKNRIVAELAELVGQATCADQQELMAAHFAEQLGVSPQRFIPEKKQAKLVQVSVPPVSSCTAQYIPSHISDTQSPPGFPTPSDEEWRWEKTLGKSEEKNISLRKLPKKQQQLLNFLLFYPEVLSDLPTGIIREALGESPVLGIVEAMEQVAGAGNVTPEKLLSVVTLDADRQYIVELLSRDGGDPLAEEDEDAMQGHKLYDELLLWLEREKMQKKGADLQARITSAQKTKDYELVDTLTRELLEIREIRRGIGT
ncbi:toprim domain-containing protein, partial [Desulfobulbus sp. TB]|nr:toprim domain-containing protein [Desulfobulbus sp. TB]